MESIFGGRNSLVLAADLAQFCYKFGSSKKFVESGLRQLEPCKEYEAIQRLNGCQGSRKAVFRWAEFLIFLTNLVPILQQIWIFKKLFQIGLLDNWCVAKSVRNFAEGRKNLN